ncbi:MAG: hypothetical protein FWE76_03740 [Symbiobacteriaceae bacterium]|nr:hypothetical protein [Symbiobacteriaceae bacterium]
MAEDAEQKVGVEGSSIQRLFSMDALLFVAAVLYPVAITLASVALSNAHPEIIAVQKAVQLGANMFLYSVLWLYISLRYKRSKNDRMMMTTGRLHMAYMAVLAAPLVPTLYNWTGIVFISALHPLTMVLLLSLGYGRMLGRVEYIAYAVAYSVLHVAIAMMANMKAQRERRIQS